MPGSGDTPASAGGEGGGAGPPLPEEEPASYGAALAELEAILAELERDDLDVDLLGAKVARAAALLRWCRTQLGTTTLEVERIVADLEG